MPLPLENKVIITVAELREALSSLSPILTVHTQLPDYDAGIQLIVKGNILEIRARQKKREGK